MNGWSCWSAHRDGGSERILEVGNVLEADLNTTTERTPLNEPLRQATKHAGGEGRL